MHPFQPRKVIRRKLGRSPTPPSTPPPDSSIFESALLHSSPSNTQDMHEANEVLKELLSSNSTLATPQRKYIVRLGEKAEQYRARITILDKQKETAEGILSGRKRAESGTRLFLKGQHFVSQEGIVEKIEAHEMGIESRKQKRAKKTNKNTEKTVEIEDEDEQELVEYDCIEVEPYRE